MMLELFTLVVSQGKLHEVPTVLPFERHKRDCKGCARCLTAEQIREMRAALRKKGGPS